MDQQPSDPPILNRAQLDIIADRIAGGVDPAGLAGWLTRVNDLGEGVGAKIEAAARDIQSGCAERWYAAADSVAVRNTDENHG
jgi:hypothetical protein